jgi:hypothetical protein
MPILILPTVGQCIVSLSLGQGFHVQVTVTLTFNLMTSKSIGVIYWSFPMPIFILLTVGQVIFKLSLRQKFHVHGHCDLDLWRDDLKMNRGHLLVIPNTHVKFEDIGSRHCQVIIQTRISCSRSLWPWHLTSKSIVVFNMAYPIPM